MSHDRIDIPNDYVEFRYWGDELDEFVAHDIDIHFEAMATGAWWMCIKTPDGRDFHVNLGVTNPKLSESKEIKWREKKLSNWARHEEDT